MTLSGESPSAHQDDMGPYSNFMDVGLFHEQFDLPTSFSPEPREIDPELMKFRTKFLKEELKEFTDALAEGNHAKMFDALMDLTYVAMGTAHILGYPWQWGWRMVQEANMAKVRAQADGSDSARGSSYDVVKPKGWVAPDIEGLLRFYGWQ